MRGIFGMRISACSLGSDCSFFVMKVLFLEAVCCILSFPCSASLQSVIAIKNQTEVISFRIKSIRYPSGVVSVHVSLLDCQV